MHREASDFLRALHGAGRSIHTIRVYAGRVASFLGWCADQGVEWSSIGLPGLARFKHFIEATPRRDGRLRSGATVNAILTAVCEFLRFCARTGVAAAKRPVARMRLRIIVWSKGSLGTLVRQVSPTPVRKGLLRL